MPAVGAAASLSVSSPAVTTAIDTAPRTSSRLVTITPSRPVLELGKSGRRIPLNAMTTAQAASRPPAM